MYSLEILHAVAALGNPNGVSFSTLDNTLTISKPALSYTLKDLMRDELVDKDPNNGFYRVTDKGIQFLEDIKKENIYVNEILRLMQQKWEARSSIASLVASIEEKVLADPILRKSIPSDHLQILHEYIAVRLEKLLEEISQGNYLRGPAIKSVASSAGTGGGSTC